MVWIVKVVCFFLNSFLEYIQEWNCGSAEWNTEIINRMQHAFVLKYLSVAHEGLEFRECCDGFNWRGLV